MNQNEKAALREILAQRESMYRLLARLYKTEADKAREKPRAKSTFFNFTDNTPHSYDLYFIIPWIICKR